MLGLKVAGTVADNATMKRVILSALAVLMLCTACGGASGDAAGKDACQNWLGFRASGGADLGLRGRALDSAQDARSSEKYRHLAADIQTYIDAFDKLSQGAAGQVNPMDAADVITAVADAGHVVDRTCGRASGTAAAS